MKTLKNKPTKPVIPVVHNNTNVVAEDLANLPILGFAVNKWRGRRITLRAHPSDESRLISVGETFCGTMIVICDEEKSAWSVELDYASRGKVYVSE